MNKHAIDESVAMVWCQHERPLLMRVLASFHQQYGEYRELTSLSAEHAQRLAHDLKSVAPSCGASALATIAACLAPPAPLPNADQQQQLLAHLQAVLLTIESDYPAALALTRSQQKDRLQELRRTLDQHNLNAIAMFQQWAVDEATSWPAAIRASIQQALDSFDFKLARQLLDNAVSNFGTTKQ